MSVAETSPSAFRDSEPLLVFRKVRQDLSCLRFLYHSPHRDMQDKVFAFSAVHILALAVLPFFGPVVLLELYIQECVDVTVGGEDNMSSPSAVAAVRASSRDELLPPEAYAAPAAVTGLDIYFCLIDKSKLKTILILSYKNFIYSTQLYILWFGFALNKKKGG